MKKENILNIIIIGVFVLIIFMPQITFFFAKSYLETDTSENRKLAEKPQFEYKTITKYPEKYNSYYNDNLPFRGYLKKAWTNINLFIFNDSTNKNVLLGKKENNNLKEMWLFYCSESDGNPVDEVQGITNFTKEQKEQMYKTIVQNTETLAQKNIRLYYLICPDKENIYKENLPDTIRVSGESRTDKLVDELRKKGVTNIIYPKEELLREKENGQLYYKQDTHWNFFGAFTGYKNAMNVIEPNLECYDYTVEWEKNKVQNRDLINMLGKSNFFVDDEPTINYFNDITYKTSTIKTETNQIEITECQNSLVDNTIMIIGDSYRSAMIPYFARTYKKCIFLHKTDFSNELVEKYAPDSIIIENVERYTFGTISNIKMNK